MEITTVLSEAQFQHILITGVICISHQSGGPWTQRGAAMLLFYLQRRVSSCCRCLWTRWAFFSGRRSPLRILPAVQLNIESPQKLPHPRSYRRVRTYFWRKSCLCWHFTDWPMLVLWVLGYFPSTIHVSKNPLRGFKEIFRGLWNQLLFCGRIIRKEKVSLC